MPTYDYYCESCGHELEVFQLMSATPLVDCPSCESPSLKRRIGLGAGVIFKGGGFYETDFKDKKGKSDKEESPKKQDSTKPADSKPVEKGKPSAEAAKPVKSKDSA